MKKNYFFIFLAGSLNVYAQVDSLNYHDQTFESQYGASGAFPGPDYVQMITRFTPAVYPVQLTGMRVWFRNAVSPAPFKIIVRQDTSSVVDANNSTLVYMSTNPIANPSSNGIPDSAYSYYADLSAENLYFNSADVYVGITQNLQQNGYVGLALDTNNLALNDRHWISTNQGIGGTWFQFSSWAFIQAQLGITAYFHYIQNDVGIISTDVIPLIYPAPASEFFKVNIPTKESFSVAVFDLDGKLQAEYYKNTSTASFDISTLEKGIYIVRLKSDHDNRFIHLKLLKE